MKKLRIATRQSPLALWQANFVRQQLLQHHPELEVELVTFVTKGDKILDTPLAKIGGKGLFVKELEHALFNHEADIAVHSIKDVPMLLPDGLVMPVICARENEYDAFVSTDFDSIDALPLSATVGTSSLRRRSQLLAYRPDLNIIDLRGNVGTRLQKLANGEYDAIILAAAGLIRLQLKDKIKQIIPSTISLPAVGQGALGIECRENDESTQQMISVLHHHDTAVCVQAERAFNRRLEGGCQMPIAAYATLFDQKINLEALVGRVDGQSIVRCSAETNWQQAEQLGLDLAERILQQGGDKILSDLK